MTTILVIDDNETNLYLMEFLLKKSGYDTKSAMNGKEGLRIAEEEPPPALIICDILMPELNGYDFIKIVRKHKKLMNIPCVAVTAQAMIGDKEKILAAGFDLYIEKPITPREFVAQISSLL